MSDELTPISRRHFIGTAATVTAGLALSKSRSEASELPSIRLVAGESQARLVPAGSTSVWSYNNSVPGPVLRARQGEPFRAVLENRFSEPTTIHWHGIRLPNAMDGVPDLTQAAVKPGQSFPYQFTPPDAGTFWYHPHADSAQQIGRGLSGAFIVEEKTPPSVDRDLLWFISDWRLMQDLQIAPDFGNMMEAGMAGRVGNLVTVNGKAQERLAVQAGERIRLRLVNASLARILALRFQGHDPRVIALDGQPARSPFVPDGGRMVLGPAMRADLIIDMTGESGKSYSVVDDFYGDRLTYQLAALSYAKTRRRKALSTAPIVLSPNPIPVPDLAQADRHMLVLQGGMMGGMGGMMGMMGSMMGSEGRSVWAINGVAGMSTGGMHPAITIKRGRSCVITLKNDTAWWHPMHLHGFSFHVIARNGKAAVRPELHDTVLVPPRETADIAFVADNPGVWMLHCHVIDHQDSGMMTLIRVV